MEKVHLKERNMDILDADHSSGEGLLGDNVVELLFGDESIVVGVGPLNHLLKF